METPEFTIVCGVDSKHLKQLEITFPTWKKNKPSLLNHPMVIFYDSEDDSVSEESIREKITHPNLKCQKWPPQKTVYPGNPKDKWTKPQRYKMLAGFVYISTSPLIQTPYMLKLDTDVIATSSNEWINPDWFDTEPAIVSQPWSFTKPANQMVSLDRWVKECWNHLPEFYKTEPLNLIPHPDKDRKGHKRIISWCSFWNVLFVRRCAIMAARTCGMFKMPVPSQDGFLWYCAKRLDSGIVRVNMKSRGWVQRLSMPNIKKVSEEVMK